MSRRSLVRSLVTVLAALTLLPACGLAQRVAVGFVYDRADLPEANVRPDLAYAADGDPKHRFNLFLPLADSVRQRPWPTVVFVHGGGWTTGDKDLTFGGADVYNNIGRFFAQHGVGAATVNYRLMPAVTWREQVEDVAAAVAAVRARVAEAGGDPDALVLMGHSAGAYLATSAALDSDALGEAGVPAGAVCGVIAVSGAALDLRDRETYALEDNFDYYSARFSPDRQPLAEPPAEPFAWQAEASPIRLVSPEAPPFLILYAGGETEALQRQSRLLDAALREADVPSRVVVVPGRSHERIVPTLSRDDQTAGPAMLRFVRTRACR